MNIEVVVLSMTFGYRKYTSHFCGSKKIKRAGKKCFRFCEVVKLTIIGDSSLSNMNI